MSSIGTHAGDRHEEFSANSDLDGIGKDKLRRSLRQRPLAGPLSPELQRSGVLVLLGSQSRWQPCRIYPANLGW
ncbi:hypothetical protein QFZ89_007846 [Paraburkholderia youngii]